jgi:hypothetical protein
MIQISNYVIDSNTIKSNYTLLNHTLDVPSVTTNAAAISVYPNPATSSIQARVLAPASYNLCDLTGRSVQTGMLQTGENKISLEYISPGVYFLKTKRGEDAAEQVYRFIKQ